MVVVVIATTGVTATALAATGGVSYAWTRVGDLPASTQRELAEGEEAKKFQARAAEALGQFVPGPGMPKLMPPGTSLHYMGTHRIGPTNDGTSVCDPYSRVWDVAGLYTGGNGTLPTANSVNPTLTSMAVAVRGARQLAADLKQ